MMPKLTVIVGYCGSGKSWFIENCISCQCKFDDGYPGDKKLISVLKLGIDCTVVNLLDLHTDRQRKAFEKKIKSKVPGVYINWLCFENDVDKANRNCEKRYKRDSRGHIRINNNVAPNYECCKNGTILKIREI